MAGGYQSLNLKGLNFGLNSAAQTVEGIWDVYQIVGSNSITTVQMSITQDDKVQFTSTTNNTMEG